MKNDKIAEYLLAGVMMVSVAAAVLGRQQSPPPAGHASPQEVQPHADCPMMKGEDKAGAAGQHAGHEGHAAHEGHSAPDAHEGHDAHDMDEMNRRGESAMGFSRTKTTHHFRLLPTGGAIEVEANEARDAASRDQVRRHLAHIAQAFAAGDFAIPSETHARIPPGVDVMKRLGATVTYQFEEVEHGGRVRISTTNPDALAAIHEFLRFQIKEHETGDSMEMSKQ